MKRTGKRFIALLLAVTCILPGAACATPEEEPVQNTVTPVEGEKAGADSVLVPEEDEGEMETEVKEQREEKENQGENLQPEGTANVLVEAVYPEMAQYPETDGITYDEDAYAAWKASVRAQQPLTSEYKNGIREFYESTMQEFLKDTEGKNKVYSPLNVYMALAMLAEITDGESREQILNLLHTDSIETLRNNASILWNANYCDDGTVTSLLASSIWLRNGMTYKEETLRTLAENYYTSSFSGTMGSAEYNKLLQGWLNEQTGGFLEKQAANVEMDPATIFALATTVYFRARWDSVFHEGSNTEEIFHTDSGDVTCEFMHQSGTNTYYWAENFSAIARELENSGEMLLILPDEDVQVEELLTDEEALEFIYSHQLWENQKRLIVNQSIPKFDVASDYSLVQGLKNLGVTDIFDTEESDFTPLITDTEAAVSAATHAARVMIDEEGCIAAAFTVMLVYGTARPPKETVDFVLDRPFLFVINGQDGQPLFIGIVNQPN